MRFPVESIGKQVMAVFVDIYGNEAREVITRSKFSVDKTASAVPPKRRKKRSKRRKA